MATTKNPGHNRAVSAAKAVLGPAPEPVDTERPAEAAPGAAPPPSAQSPDYVLPLVHARVPAAVVNRGFWLVLGGAALAGAVELPLAALVGAGVIVARHRRR